MVFTSAVVVDAPADDAVGGVLAVDLLADTVVTSRHCLTAADFRTGI
jgi:hypothetical protein